uniref:ASD2 domain-containing protein n=1 Tax=Ciona savignyi TaxID=51511 RepID=H2ZIQ7_CIOSA
REEAKNCEPLPASSKYYKTSASKARILNLVKEKIADGEIDPEDDNVEDINSKKVELVLSIKSKLCELESMKETLQVEMRENERLGGQVLTLVQRVCSDREQEKYNIFAHDVDKIINLLLSLSGRMARVENAIEMLHPNADKHEMEQLEEKRRKLAEQHVEARQLKANIDRRQKAVSETLAAYFDQEQFADYEHYIKMKSALIMEQRELDDKAKLGEEQMQCLTESLSEEWQQRLQSI